MKRKLVIAIVMSSLALQLVACGAGSNAKAGEAASTTAESTDGGSEESADTTAEGETSAENTESGEEKTSEEKADNDENVNMANPWRECTEEEAIAACPRMFKAPAEDLVQSWSMMDVKDSVEGVPGPVVQLDFRMDGMDFTARAQYGADENEDISGLNYDWTVTDDVTLANWGEGNMPAKMSRYVDDGWTIDLITWYDIEIGIAYSLSVEAEDLDGFDIQAIAEQMYNGDNEALAEGLPEDDGSQSETSGFAGQYYAGRGNLSITDHGDNNYFIEVWWGSSASEHSEWSMNGTYDESTKTITYKDCVKHDYELDENGEIVKDETAYSDGTGSIQIVDDNTIIWTDDQDHIADDISMTR